MKLFLLFIAFALQACTTVQVEPPPDTPQPGSSAKVIFFPNNVVITR